VMFVLKRVLASGRPGELGCAMAFGPGLMAETLLFHVESSPARRTAHFDDADAREPGRAREAACEPTLRLRCHAWEGGEE